MTHKRSNYLIIAFLCFLVAAFILLAFQDGLAQTLTANPEPEADTVVIVINGAEAIEVDVAEDGSWSYDMTSYRDVGPITIVVHYCDVWGKCSTDVTLTDDTNTPPPAVEQLIIQKGTTVVVSGTLELRMVQEGLAGNDP